MKTHGYNNNHDETKPAQIWFENSQEGLTLFVVLYTLACRWQKCVSCNLPSLCSSRHIGFESLMKQIDNLYADSEILRQREEIKKVILSNNGSVLDEKTFSSTALMYFLAKTNMLLPNLAVFSLETRPEFVDVAELEFLSRALKEGKTPTDLEIAVGFEAFNDRIRNEVFNKGLTLKVFEDFVEKVAKYHYRLKCYFMQKPVAGISDEEAIQDIKKGIDYLSAIASRFNLPVNMHLNPTFVARGTFLEEAFLRGEYQPPKLADVIQAVKHAQGKGISIYVSLFDEGLASPGGSFIRQGDEELVKKLEEFNSTQDFSFLN
ncbi:MAG: hypothetical protein HYV47_01905 [Candidatus Nealsonbacteria bacterium]|nr:hypothetical protein [Candidatus Nealsonbacteria bacterium]